jgi:hypothetical protein
MGRVKSEGRNLKGFDLIKIEGCLIAGSKYPSNVEIARRNKKTISYNSPIVKERIKVKRSNIRKE